MLIRISLINVPALSISFSHKHHTHDCTRQVIKHRKFTKSQIICPHSVRDSDQLNWAICRPMLWHIKLYQWFLLRPRERLRSIVMSAFVCLCVCLSARTSPEPCTRAIFTKFFVHVAYVRGSVLLQQVDDGPHRLLLGILTMHCKRDHSITNNVMQHKESAAFAEMVSAGKGVTGVHSAGEV